MQARSSTEFAELAVRSCRRHHREEKGPGHNLASISSPNGLQTAVRLRQRYAVRKAKRSALIVSACPMNRGYLGVIMNLGKNNLGVSRCRRLLRDVYFGVSLALAGVTMIVR